VKQFKTIIIYFLLITFILSSCSRKAAPFRAEVSFITGTLKINNVEASVGNTVVKDDLLATGVKSEAVIQVTDTAVITLKPETELRFENILLNNNDTRTVSMELNKGTSLHNVLKKGTDYSVKAPTAVASVRGTVFEVSETGSRTFIAVEAGTVSVRKLSGKIKKNSSLTDGQRNGAEEIILTAGQSLELYSAEHKKTSTRNLHVPKKTAETKKIDTIKEYISYNAKEQKDATPQSIDRITLYSGEIITGTILERGETYSIDTGDGIKKISRKDIRNNEIVK